MKLTPLLTLVLCGLESALAQPSTIAAGPGLSCPLGERIAHGSGNDTDADALLYHPRFHIMPPTRTSQPSGMNDMNAMFYSKGMYHVTYQDHIHCPDDINQANQSFGHVVSVRSCATCWPCWSCCCWWWWPCCWWWSC